MALRLLGKRIAVVPPTEETTETGIHLVLKNAPRKGALIVSSPAAHKMGFDREGTIVHFGRHAGQVVELQSGPYPKLIVLDVDEVLAVE